MKEVWGMDPYTHVLTYKKTDTSIGFSVLPWCPLGIAHICPLLYQHCFG